MTRDFLWEENKHFYRKNITSKMDCGKSMKQLQLHFHSNLSTETTPHDIDLDGEIALLENRVMNKI